MGVGYTDITRSESSVDVTPVALDVQRGDRSVEVLPVREYREAGDAIMRKRLRMRAVLRKVGDVLLKGVVAGCVRWALEQWLGS